MKNILVPTDFSAEAHHAFRTALQLARRTGGSVTLLHVLALPDQPRTANFSSFGGPVGSAELSGTHGIDRIFVIKLMEATRQRMHLLLAEAAQLAPDVPVHDLTDQVDVDDAILKVIEQRHIDLVVLGTQQHDAIERFFASSNTEQLVRLAPCPVLAVKQAADLDAVRDIVFASDFGDEADQAVPGLRQVRQLFPEAQLHLLHVTDENAGQARQQIDDFIERHQLAPAEAVLMEAGSISSGITDAARKLAAGLIVVPTHARSAFSRFFQGSVAEKVAFQSAQPVLTFHL
ncbi:universal stress protein [Hymenobacter psychrophilus]|uniref:Nucleotide-binding universal stress protein, UspA family n=1 Tax=Hymenobacter psychrophilus TaxID=651662 RepID=A0A1H3IW68_9BACT|nr:universal stress protein [Hymenobacter psychrophilus]SDY31986.1 Nucleotide-binding universal stress protein, UspA family [Hymenobacter psychrophilus]